MEKSMTEIRVKKRNGRGGEDLKLEKIHGRFTKIFVDVNGSRKLPFLAELLESYERALSPDLIIVKSVKLKTLLLSSTPYGSDATVPRVCHWQWFAAGALAALVLNRALFYS